MWVITSKDVRSRHGQRVLARAWSKRPGLDPGKPDPGEPGVKGLTQLTLRSDRSLHPRRLAFCSPSITPPNDSRRRGLSTRKRRKDPGVTSNGSSPCTLTCERDRVPSQALVFNFVSFARAPDGSFFFSHSLLSWD